jgi:hypothetical protein
MENWRAEQLIVSFKASKELLNWLESLGVHIIPSMENNQVDERIRDHPDLFVFTHQNKFIIDPGHIAHYSAHMNHGMILQGKTSTSRPYPLDTCYNAIVIGGQLLGSEVIDNYIVKLFGSSIELRQGYVKCNILKVDDHSLITSDKGIAARLENLYEVLLIQEGHIALDGFPHGFIGGASGHVSSEEIIFTGNMEGHPDYEKMKTFIEDRGKKMMYPTHLEPVDLGSLIPIIGMED